MENRERFELSTSDLRGQRSNQLSYRFILGFCLVDRENSAISTRDLKDRRSASELPVHKTKARHQPSVGTDFRPDAAMVRREALYV